MTSPAVTVGIYSQQEIVREGIMSLLSRHPDKVEVVATPTHPGDPDPDVVLYDVMALLNGDTGPLSYLVDMTASKVLAVGHDLRPDLVGQALTIGVDGFFSIGADEKELLAAVESAATGWKVGDPGDDPTVGAAGSRARAEQDGGDAGLTTRETQVLRLITNGLSNQEIADELYVSINSVKSFIRTAYRKVGVRSRGGAVAWGIRHGFTSQD